MRLIPLRVNDINLSWLSHKRQINCKRKSSLTVMSHSNPKLKYLA
jgi:hypothetical protein